jgi:prepilin-type N-terminal cleavage/methylation domain-containing protein
MSRPGSPNPPPSAAGPEPVWKESRTPFPGADARRGFSLFEMLVALIILAIMAGMAGPALGRLLDGLKFRQQTRHYSAILRYARLLAVSHGETVRLRLDKEIEECVFELSGPVEVRKDCELQDQDILVMDPGDLYFFPEGYATPGTLTFTKGQRVARLRLDLLTGRPEQEGRE